MTLSNHDVSRQSFVSDATTCCQFVGIELKISLHLVLATCSGRHTDTGNWTQRRTLTDRGACILTDMHKYLQRDRWQHTEPMPAAQLESYAVTYDCKALTCIQNEMSCLLHNDE